jgi:hypothetical protein
MRHTKKVGMFFLMLLLLTTIAPLVGATSVPQTHLFLNLETGWEHANPGDIFVVRANVKNIGDVPAFLIRVRLQNVPDDWVVRPSCFPWILLLQPGQTKPRFFIVQRGQTDATVYAKAKAYNAPLVESNRIPIPIDLGVIIALSLLGGVLLYRESRIRNKRI